MAELVRKAGRLRLPAARKHERAKKEGYVRSPRTLMEDWRVLRALGLYRLLLLIILVVAEQAGYAAHFFPNLHNSIFHGICIGYALAALIIVLIVYREWPALPTQVPVQFTIDVIGVTLLVYASGGVSTGVGALLITPMVGFSLISNARTALTCALIGTLFMLFEEAFRLLQMDTAPIAFGTVGILGLIFFGTSIAGNAAGRRTRRSEALAARTGSDLENMSELNSRIIESMETGVLVVNRDGTIRLFNNAARRLLNLKSVAAGAWLPQVAPRLDAAITRWRRGEVRDNPMLNERDGEELVPRFMNLGSQTDDPPALILLNSAAELREQAQQMKLAALGRLSAGIAHEIRNPLSAIQQAEQLLAESTHITDEDRRLIRVIERHTARLERIVRDVLGLSRRENITRSQITMKPWLDRCITLYHEAHPDRVGHVEVLHVDDGLEVRFDSSHLQQIVHNLWDNSFEHGTVDGKPIRISLRGYRLPSNRQPCLEISDDGKGIPDEVADKIFEPFFTTAGRTTGTGLGLYLARELCEYNRGRLHYQRGERGAMFRITFDSA